MRNFNELIDNLFAYAMKNKKSSPAIEDIDEYRFQKKMTTYDDFDGYDTFLDDRHNHVRYKIDVMPQSSKGAKNLEPVPLRYKTTLLSQSGVEEVVTRIQLYVGKYVKKSTLVVTLEKDPEKRVIHFDYGDDFEFFTEYQIIPLNMMRGIAQFDATFYRMGVFLDWRQMSSQSDDEDDSMRISRYRSRYDSIYTRDIVDQYTKIHQEVQNEVLSLISFYLKEVSQSNHLRLNLVDAACGKLGLVKNLSAAIHRQFPRKIEIRRVGFDLLSDNVEHTQQQDPEGLYVKADLSCPDKVIHLARQKQRLFNSEEKLENETKTIVVATGALTRLVLQNTFSCVESLQAFSHSGVDAIFCSGRHEPLFTSIAKRVGMMMETSEKGVNTIHVLKPLSLEAMLHQKIHSFEKQRPLLDLSLSSCPLSILKNFPDRYKADVKVLDISFSRIDSKKLATVLALYPNLRKVISYQENKFKKMDLESSKKEWPAGIELISEVVGNEIFLMSANARKRVFGLFDNKLNLEVYEKERAECQHIQKPELVFDARIPDRDNSLEGDAIPSAMIQKIEALRIDLDNEVKNMISDCPSFFLIYEVNTKKEKYHILTSMLQAKTLTELRAIAMAAKTNDRVMRSVFSSRVKNLIDDIVSIPSSLTLGMHATGPSL